MMIGRVKFRGGGEKFNSERKRDESSCGNCW